MDKEEKEKMEKEEQEEGKEEDLKEDREDGKGGGGSEGEGAGVFPCQSQSGVSAGQATINTRSVGGALFSITSACNIRMV